MSLEGLNWLAMIVAGVIYFVLGALWYSPLLFANVFIRYRGMTSEEIRASGVPTDYLLALVTDLISALVVAVIVNMANTTTFVDGLVVGLVLAAGLAATSALKYTIFSGPHKMLWVIYTGYQLVGYAIMGILLTVWQ